MVHRAPDARLLANLIANEKEHAKHLVALFPIAHAALASLSAYAAAAPSSAAHAIAAAVNAIAGADDALQRYAYAVDAWRRQLVALKDLEDELTAVLRDRDILVTRLIKASKPARRSSRIITPPAGLGSASLSSLPSTSSAGPGTVPASGTGSAGAHSKLAQAEAELRACEAHLVAKERELDARRISIARDTLGARCRALIDCGWVWGEMGQKGLEALRVLGTADGADVLGVATSKTSTSMSTFAAHTTYASDSSSLTPSQSASQGATRSAETSHKATSKKHRDALPEAVVTHAQLRTSSAEDYERDITPTLPPAHAVSDLAHTTGVHELPHFTEDSGPQKSNAATTTYRPSLSHSPSHAVVPTPRRRATKRSRRPPSHHIIEASDEGTDGPPDRKRYSSSNTIVNADVIRNPNPSTNTSRTPFPTRAQAGAHDTSSDEDEHPAGSFTVVDNDPFEAIRKSMHGESNAPRASVSRSRGWDLSAGTPSNAVFPIFGSARGPGPGQEAEQGTTRSSGSGKRQRRTSMALFGSIRGLFRKPRERDMVGVEWDGSGAGGHTSPVRSPLPSPTARSSNAAKAKNKANGWMTRTDARIWGRDEDSDLEHMSEAATTGTNVRVARRGSRLRKGRPRQLNDDGSAIGAARGGVDGWVTDGAAAVGSGTNGSGGGGGDGGPGTGTGTELDMRTGGVRPRRGTVKRRKMSVADLRGHEQGHTDGEVDERHASRTTEDGIPRAPVSVFGRDSEPGVGVEQWPRAATTVEDDMAMANADADRGTAGSQHRRATTTTEDVPATPRHRHRRSASLSFVDTHATSSASAGGNVAPSSDEISRTVSLSRTQPQPPTRAQTESSKHQHSRRHAHAHVQNQSLMSIVADVTRDPVQDQDWTWGGATDGTETSLARAPRSVLTVIAGQAGERLALGGAARASVDGAGGIEQDHARSTPAKVSSTGTGVGQRPAQAKMPLRSALRNASRTPSPVPATISRNDKPLPEKEEAAQVGEQERADARGARTISLQSLRDSASISSYATGRESLEGEEVDEERVSSPTPSPPLPHPRSRSASPVVHFQTDSPAPRSRSHSPPPFSFPPPPAVDPPGIRETTSSPHPNAKTSANGDTKLKLDAVAVEFPPSSSVSTETPPVRRKSVRVSLPPTFSPTPPALCDDDGEDYAPWSASFSTREEGERGRERKTHRDRKRVGSAGVDAWADSSDEDEAYTRARRLLSLVGGSQAGKEGKGKGKARSRA